MTLANLSQLFLNKLFCLKKLQFVQALSNQVLQVIKDLI